jgi:hypothetical protein
VYICPRPAHSRKVSTAVVAFALYSLLTVALTYPLVFELSTSLPHDLGDPLLNTWILWWNARQLPLTDAWWNAPSFYPAPGCMAFSEHLLGLAPITSPVQWLGGAPSLAYNIAFLVSFPLSALTAHLLGLELTRRHDAACVAGLTFGFGRYRAAHLAHLQILSSYWMPLALLGLHAFLRTRRSRWLALFGAAWAMQGLCNGYYLLYFPVLLLLWITWFAIRAGKTRLAIGITGAWLLAALPLLPILRGYTEIHARYGFKRGLGEIVAFSADVISLAGSRVMAGLGIEPNPEGEICPGLSLCLLVAAGLVAAWRRREDARPERRSLRLGLAALAAAFALIALSAVTLGPWRVSLGGIHISVRAVEKPLSLACAGLLAVAATGEGLRGAYRRASPFGFYATASAAMWLLSLGPSPRLLSMPVLYEAPYAWLLLLPGFDALRAPARFAMLMTLCLSMVAALTVARFAQWRPRWSRLLLCLAVAGALWDGWLPSLALEPLPLDAPDLRAWRALRSAVLELPLGGEQDRVALFRGISHGLPVVNGYSGYEPPHYGALRLGLKARMDDTLTRLTSRGPLFVIIEPDHDQRGRWRRYVLRQAGARVLQDGRLGVYLLSAIPSPQVDREPDAPPLSAEFSTDGPGGPGKTHREINASRDFGAAHLLQAEQLPQPLRLAPRHLDQLSFGKFHNQPSVNLVVHALNPLQVDDL